MPTKSKATPNEEGPQPAWTPLSYEEVLNLRAGDNITSTKMIFGYARLLKNPHSEKLKDGTGAIILALRDTLSEHGIHDFKLVVRSSEYRTGMIRKGDIDIAIKNIEKTFAWRKQKKSE